MLSETGQSQGQILVTHVHKVPGVVRSIETESRWMSVAGGEELVFNRDCRLYYGEARKGSGDDSGEACTL